MLVGILVAQVLAWDPALKGGPRGGPQAWAEEAPAPADYGRSMREGIAAFQQGRLDEAVGKFEDALALQPGSAAARDRLVAALPEKARRLVQAGAREDAKKAVLRALNIAPSDAGARDLLSSLEAPPPTAKPAPPPAAPPPPSPHVARPVARPSGRESVNDSQAKAWATTRIAAQLEAVVRGQKDLEARLGTASKVLVVETMHLRWVRWLFLTTVGAALVSLLFVLGLFVLGRRSQFRIEADLRRDREKLLSALEDRQASVVSQLGHLALQQAGERERMSLRDLLASANPHVRALGVEQLAEDLVRRGDPIEAVRQMTPFLRDPHNRVRANAAVAMHHYDPEMARTTLVEMLAAGDRWSQASAAWAFGHLGDPDGLKALFSRFREMDSHARARALKTFRGALENYIERLPGDLRKSLQNLLREMGEKAPAAQPLPKAVQVALESVDEALSLGTATAVLREAVVHYRRGEVLFADGKYSAARLEFSETLRLEPQFWRAMVYLGNCFYKTGQIPRALRCYEEAWRINPQLTDLHRMFQKEPAPAEGTAATRHGAQAAGGPTT